MKEPCFRLREAQDKGSEVKVCWRRDKETCVAVTECAEEQERR